MAPSGRRSGLDLALALQEGPQRFGFFQAVRILSLMGQGASGGVPPADLRFRTPANLSFPGSEVVRFTPATSADGSPSRPELEVAFLGLTGPSGALPAAYTEMVTERRLHHQDTALHAFFDLFSHRAVNLFYSSWAKQRPFLLLETGRSGGFSQDLLALSGLALRATRPGEVLSGLGAPSAFFAGMAGRRPLPSQSLRAIVEGSLGAPVRLEQFVSQWMEVPMEGRTALGAPGQGLGQGAFLGGGQQDCQNTVRFVLGPLDRETFQDLLPGGSRANFIQGLLHRLVGPALVCQVRLVLKGGEVPTVRLNSGQPARLGWDSWLPSAEPLRNRGEALFQVET